MLAVTASRPGGRDWHRVELGGQSNDLDRARRCHILIAKICGEVNIAPNRDWAGQAGGPAMSGMPR